MGNITFDNEKNTDCIWTETGGVFGPNNKDATIFDYFSNNAQANDAIYFCLGFYVSSPQGVWHNIKFYVGTAFDADSVTFVWEYMTDQNTWASLNVTDNTNGFTVLGENWVTFDIPTDWYLRGMFVNGKGGQWIRCRITAITNCREGGAQSTQKIKGRDYAITVTGTGNTLNSIYTADLAGSWGVVTKQESQYLLKANLIIGDGITTSELKDTGVQLQIGEEPTTTIAQGMTRYIIVETNATFQLGERGTGYDYGGKGNSLVICHPWAYYYNISNGTWKMYGVTIDIKGHSFTTYLKGVIDFRDVSLTVTKSGADLFFSAGCSGIIRRFNTYGELAYGFMLYSSLLDIEDVILENTAMGISCGYDGSIVIVKDAAFRAGTTTHLRGGGGIGTNFDLIDSDWNEDKYYTLGGVNEWAKNRKSFKLKVIDKNGDPIVGAIVDITDINGNRFCYEDSGADLNQSIDYTTITLIVTDSSVFSVGDIILIHSEFMEITEIPSSTTITVTRNYWSSKPAKWKTGSNIYIITSLITDSNGEIPKNVFTIANYINAGNGIGQGIPSKVTKTSFSPFTLTINREGYWTYQVKFDLTKKTEWIIALPPYDTEIPAQPTGLFVDTPPARPSGLSIENPDPAPARPSGLTIEEV